MAAVNCSSALWLEVYQHHTFMVPQHSVFSLPADFTAWNVLTHGNPVAFPLHACKLHLQRMVMDPCLVSSDYEVEKFMAVNSRNGAHKPSFALCGLPVLLTVVTAHTSGGILTPEVPRDRPTYSGSLTIMLLLLQIALLTHVLFGVLVVVLLPLISPSPVLICSVVKWAHHFAAFCWHITSFLLTLTGWWVSAADISVGFRNWTAACALCLVHSFSWITMFNWQPSPHVQCKVLQTENIRLLHSKSDQYNTT